ncbi:MAG: hypothetical protein Q8S73_20700, partial [Deltaproteobacteria bacterium]|nr:hypothetical protein [Deltaproteobacteria bacterium]
SHCGGCGRACSLANATSVCSAGACAVATCAPSFGDCDGNAANGCEADTRSAVAHCGACGAACPSAPRSVAVCAGGVCDALCTAGFADCDGVASNGCEVDTRTAAAHCGGCGRACPSGNTMATCAASACVIGACAAGFGDCDGSAATGCETSTSTSLAHCGACGRACTTGPNATAACAGGDCTAVCASNYGNCDGVVANGCETDLRTSAANCGACGRTGVEVCDGVDNDCDGLVDEGFSALGCVPLACTGAGLIQTIPDGCVNDGGGSAGGDSLQVYCSGGIARFCLSGEQCPWRSGLTTAPTVTCSRSGLASDFMARVSCSPWNGRTNYSCDSAGRIFFP